MENPIKMDDLGGKNPYFWVDTRMVNKWYSPCLRLGAPYNPYHPPFTAPESSHWPPEVSPDGLPIRPLEPSPGEMEEEFTRGVGKKEVSGGKNG